MVNKVNELVLYTLKDYYLNNSVFFFAKDFTLFLCLCSRSG